MIIIEGADGTGKTTLARQLITRLKLSQQAYIHVGQPPGQAAWPAWIQYTDMIMSEAVPSNGIIDRFIYGESVYGPVMRCDRRFTAPYRRMLERILMSRRTVVVFCKPPYEWARKNWADRRQRGQEYVLDEEKYRQIWRLFIEVMAAAHLPVLVYDATKDTPDALVTRIAAARPPVNTGPGYGWYEKGVTLLIGDKVNDTTGIQDWPFVAASGCSPWLAEQLENAVIPERALYWINHLTPLNGRHVSTATDFIMDLKPRQIITLGDVAHGWCTMRGIPHVTVAHPQYWRRFKQSAPYPLIKLLEAR